MKGDLLVPVVVPIVFLVLIVVTAIMIQAWDLTSPILNQTMQQYNVNATFKAIPQHIADNLYNFNYYLVLIFYIVLIASIFSTVLLNSDPIAWIVGIVYLPFVYYVSLWISNIAHGVLGNPILASGVSHLPLPLDIMAQLNLIVIPIAIIYMVAIAIRIWFYNPAQGPQGPRTSSGGLYGGR